MDYQIQRKYNSLISIDKDINVLSKLEFRHKVCIFVSCLFEDTSVPHQECFKQSRSKIAESSDSRNKHKNKTHSNDIDYLIGKTVGFLNSLIGPTRRPQVSSKVIPFCYIAQNVHKN